MKLTIASLTIYVTLALVTRQPTATEGHILDLPPEFLHDSSSNVLEVEADAAAAAMGKGRPLELDGGRKSHHCSVEVEMRIPGKCKYLGRAGVACMAGDYIDLLNKDCTM